MYALLQSLNAVLEALHLCLHGVQMIVHNMLSQFCSMMHAGTEVSFPPRSSSPVRWSLVCTSFCQQGLTQRSQLTHSLNFKAVRRGKTTTNKQLEQLQRKCASQEVQLLMRICIHDNAIPSCKLYD